MPVWQNVYKSVSFYQFSYEKSYMFLKMIIYFLMRPARSRVRAWVQPSMPVVCGYSTADQAGALRFLSMKSNLGVYLITPTTEDHF